MKLEDMLIAINYQGPRARYYCLIKKPPQNPPKTTKQQTTKQQKRKNRLHLRSLSNAIDSTSLQLQAQRLSVYVD